MLVPVMSTSNSVLRALRVSSALLLLLSACSTSASTAEQVIPSDRAASINPQGKVSPALPSPKAVSEYVLGSRAAEEAKAIVDAVNRIPGGERAALLAVLKDDTQRLSYHPDPEVARLASVVYEIRTLELAARQRDNSRDAARGLSTTATLALASAQDSLGDARAIVVRRAGVPRVNVILLRPDASAADVGIALGALQSLRRIQGDILLQPARVPVTGPSVARGEPSGELLARWNGYLAKLRSAPLQHFPEFGARASFDVALPPIARQAK